MPARILSFNRKGCSLCHRVVENPNDILECLTCMMRHCRGCSLPICTDDPFVADAMVAEGKL
jgi:hypothetical protein